MGDSFSEWQTMARVCQPQGADNNSLWFLMIKLKIKSSIFKAQVRSWRPRCPESRQETLLHSLFFLLSLHEEQSSWSVWSPGKGDWGYDRVAALHYPHSAGEKEGLVGHAVVIDGHMTLKKDNTFIAATSAEILSIDVIEAMITMVYLI